MRAVALLVRLSSLLLWWLLATIARFVMGGKTAPIGGRPVTLRLVVG